MTDHIHIREALSSEIGEILRQRRAMFEDMGFTQPHALDRMETTSAEFIRDALGRGILRHWFAEASGRIVGGVSVMTPPWVSNPDDCQPRKAYILNMYVYPECRRQGVARKALEHAIDWCRGQGFRSVYLHASDMGRPLYEMLGFKPTNEMRLTLDSAIASPHGVPAHPQESMT